MGITLMIYDVFTLLHNNAMSYQQGIMMSKTIDLGVDNEKFVINVFDIFRRE